MSTSPQKDSEAEPEVIQPPEESNRDIQDKNGVMGDNQAGLYDTEVKEQDRWLPIANVARIMKTALPENAKIAKEAKECMQECVSEFISFITSEASEKCQQEKRKTVNGEDILFAMSSLGFENYGEALKIYLSRYRETQMSKTDNQNRPSTGYEATGEAEAGNTETAGAGTNVNDDEETSGNGAGGVTLAGTGAFGVGGTAGLDAPGHDDTSFNYGVTSSTSAADY